MSTNFPANRSAQNLLCSARKNIASLTLARFCLRLEVTIQDSSPVHIPLRCRKAISFGLKTSRTQEMNTWALFLSRACFQRSCHLWSALLTSLKNNGRHVSSAHTSRERDGIIYLHCNCLVLNLEILEQNTNTLFTRCSIFLGFFKK